MTSKAHDIYLYRIMSISLITQYMEFIHILNNMIVEDK